MKYQKIIVAMMAISMTFGGTGMAALAQEGSMYEGTLQKSEHSLQLGENVLGTIVDLLQADENKSSVYTYFTAPKTGYYCITAGGSRISGVDIRNVTDGTIIISGKGPYDYQSHTVSMEQGKTYCFAFSIFENANAVLTVSVEERTGGDYTYKNLDDGTVEITGYIGEDTSLVIPGELDEKKVTGIGKYAFWNGSSLTDIAISEGVTYIAEGAFADCINLKSVIIPKSMLSIGESAFTGCKSLESVEIPENVQKIGNSPFYNCSSLKEICVNEKNSSYTSEQGVLFNKERTVLIQYPAGKETAVYTIPEGIAVIAQSAFVNCKKISNITLPETLKNIEQSGFYGCEKLKDIIIPEGAVSIGEMAFAFCNSLKDITIPESVNEIGTLAFTSCSNLGKIVILNPQCVIGASDFGTAPALISGAAVIYGYTNSTAESYAAEFGKSFVSLGKKDNQQQNDQQQNNQQGGSNQLPTDNKGNSTKEESDNQLPANGEKLSDAKTKAVYIVTESGSAVAYAGTGNKKAASVTIPVTVKIGNITYKVTSVADSAFKNCKKLKKVIIGSNITEIGQQAFYGCKNLKSITVKSKVLKKVGSKAFKGIHGKAKIKVPKAKLKDYKKRLKGKGQGKKVKIVK